MRKAAGKVLVGLSGGVDSAVAAMLLLEQGYSVTGVMMAVYRGSGGGAAGNACYGPGEDGDIVKAAAVAACLCIPFHVIDCADAYAEHVLGYFRRSYLAGETPNPCVRCNHVMKFGLLPARAREMGLEAEFFATGHYARAVHSPEYGVRLLMRGADRRRDQSYFLCRLSPEQVESALFPLGGMAKEEVRDLAKKAGLPVHDARDSQDFYAGPYQELLGAPALEGAVVDESGRELGRHQGYWNFTPGQRRGLRVAASEPIYVLRVNPTHNQVVVGPKAALLRSSCLLADCSFFVPLARIKSALSARMRSSQEPTPVSAREEEGLLRLHFESPQPGPARGQTAVLYTGDTLVGCGVIQ